MKTYVYAAKMLVLVIFTLLAAASAAAAASYTIIDLGPITGYTTSRGQALNNSGEAVGQLEDISVPVMRGFLYDGTVQELATLGGSESSAWGINDVGQVIGRAQTAGSLSHACIWVSPGYAEDLGTLGGSSSYGEDINNYGEAVGVADDPTSGQIRGWIYLPVGNRYSLAPGMYQIDPLSGDLNTDAVAIADNGSVYGRSEDGMGNGSVYVWDPVAGLVELNGFAGVNPYPADANEIGQVVGGADVGGAYRAFLWEAGSLQYITPLGTSGYAMSVNESGSVVGEADGTAFLWTQTGGMMTLNSLIDPAWGWDLWTADGINDLGQIVGSGTFNGQTHAFLLTPDNAAVPEPASIVFFATGLFALGFAIKRRKRVRHDRTQTG